MLGFRTLYEVLSDQVIASDNVLGTVGLTSPIPANTKQKIRAWVPFSVGATGGIQSQIVVPAAATLIIVSTTLFNPVSPSTIPDINNTGAAFANALAVAGTHYLVVEAIIENGVNAGNVDLQFAQNSIDVLPLTVFKGGVMEVVKF